jgi:hypothetical protein
MLPSCLYALLLVVGMRRRSLEDQLRLLSMSSAMTLRRPSPVATAAAGTPFPSLSGEFQPLRFDEYGAHGESALEKVENFSIRIIIRAYCSPGAALHRLLRVISYSTGLTKLFLYWHDSRQRLPIRRLLYHLQYTCCDCLTFSRKHVNVYAVLSISSLHLCANPTSRSSRLGDKGTRLY